MPNVDRTTAEALALFDGLPTVTPEEMLGAWRGEGFPTGHPLDGVLEAFRWQGKRFESLEEVHPLVFHAPGGGLVSVNPGLVPMALLCAPWVGRLAPLGGVFPWLAPLGATRGSGARLRATLHRGQVTATMVYDALPILDVFRRLDARTLLGVMDAKGMEQPFFFLLRQEGDAPSGARLTSP
ncbi:MAG: DUF4334 domain-containing protein [Cyanobacteriota bacterium]|nr:DUF4334 domain-containing protein [Cyanobacteriota bacterium]